MIGLKLVLALGLGLIIAAAGVAWRINDAAYDRGKTAGVTETTARMKKAIAEMTKVATQNQSQWQQKTPGEKTTELQKRCVAACQQEPKCEAACKE